MSLGAFCIVLHGHLPWVLHHGRWPHGEDWLFEAASETWLPLLGVLEACEQEGLRPAWTVGLMPILLEQLSSARFTGGFAVWLAERAARAELDHTEFAGRGDPELATLALREAGRFRGQLARFEGMRRDIPGALRRHRDAGRIELLSSNATHGYHPLILHDQCARAQIRAGLATTERHLGNRPAGVWLPECAYRPAGRWVPPVVHGDRRERAGVATLFADEGVRYFFVDTHLVAESRSEAVIDGERHIAVGWDHLLSDPRRGWRSPLEPHRVAESGTVTNLTVLARHPSVSEQVWSGEYGYPGDGRYLEFHKMHGMRGLRYWRVTGRGTDLGAKLHYEPEAAAAAAREHAAHLLGVVEGALRGHREATGRSGIVCAPFDAELFGHWWHEGPEWLLELARVMHHAEVEALTVGEALARWPADKAVALPEGTWGANGDHSVWLNEDLRFYWEVAYRAEDRFLDLWHRVDWRGRPRVRELLTEAARQLLLLQASDWAFVISTGGAVDYGMRRILEHAARFDDLCNGVEDAWSGAPEDPVTAEALRFTRLTDAVFPDLDLGWWA
jgi:1,4-alpha-glucan branching enzyme